MRLAAPPAVPPTAQRVQAVVDQWQEATGVPGVAVSVRSAGRAIADVASGVASLRTGRPLTTADRMWAGSITKTAVAALTVALAEDGALSLDDTIDRWYPGRPRASEISVRRLLDHTSGLGDPTNDPGSAYAKAFADAPLQPWSRGRLLDEVFGHEGAVAPGAHAYSNSNYILLGDILERVAGASLQALASRRLFDRADVESSIDAGSGDNPTTVSAHAGPGRGAQYEEHTEELLGAGSMLRSTIGPAGGMVTTAGDLARLGEAILWKGGAALSGSARAAMLEGTSSSPAGYGFGVVRGTLDGMAAFGHNGHLGGSGSARLLHVPETQQTISIMLPSDPPDGDAMGPFAELARAVLAAVSER